MKWINDLVNSEPYMFLETVRELIDAVWARVFPEQFFRRHLILMKDKENIIVLCGLLHNAYIGSLKIGLRLIKSIVSGYQPMAVGIEVRQQDFANDLVGLSPIDMIFCAALIRKMRIPIFGVDFWDESEFRQQASAKWNIDFNSAARNKRIADNILNGLCHSNKIVVFLGYSHIQPIRKHLHRAGFIRGQFKSGWAVNSQMENDIIWDLWPSVEKDIVNAITYLTGVVDHLESNGERSAWSFRLRRKREKLIVLMNSMQIPSNRDSREST